MAEGVGPHLLVCLCSYLLAFVRFGCLPVAKGDAQRHGGFHGILMESGDSVPDHERV